MKLKECFGGFATETSVPKLSGDVELDQLERGLVIRLMDKSEANELIAVNDDIRVAARVLPVCVEIRIGETWRCPEISEVGFHHALNALSRTARSKAHLKRHGRQRIRDA
jgi:hypothetical protein